MYVPTIRNALNMQFEIPNALFSDLVPIFPDMSLESVQKCQINNKIFIAKKKMC